MLDISQSIDRTPFGRGRTACITPGAKMVLRRANRKIYGEESLMLQGLWARHVPGSLRAFEDAQLQNLAGNAFCVGCSNKAIVAILMVARW